jgi:murein DD-endopeptidase MepM/ murein hydrolase activator NlpD
MLIKFSKIQTIILTSAIIFGSTSNISSAFANPPELKEKTPVILPIELGKIQLKETISGISNQYNQILKGATGLFNKNIDKVQISNKINRGDRKKQTTHRSLAVGVTEDGKLQTGRSLWPTTKVSVISGYGARGRGFHHGIDIYNSYGADVFSVFKGTVSYAGWMSGYGNLIEVKHKNGLSTRYAHLSAIQVKVGQAVDPGEVIGNVGNTGRVTCTHLHFEVRMNGVSVPPLAYIR